MHIENSYLTYLISFDNSKEVKSNLKLYGSGLFFCIPSKDKLIYELAGAKNIITHDGCLSNCRNGILNHCFDKNKICVQVLDEKFEIYQNNFLGTYRQKKTQFDKSVKMIVSDMLKTPAFLSGPPSFSNPFYLKDPFHFSKQLSSHLIIIKPNNIRFDCSVENNEVLDYTLQHIQKLSCVLCNSKIIIKTRGKQKNLLDQALIQKWNGALQYKGDKMYIAPKSVLSEVL